MSNKAWKSLAMMGLGMLAASGEKSLYMTENDNQRLNEEKRRYVCGNCIHCPEGKKTYCKTAGKSVGKYTPCFRCDYFKGKD